MFPIVAGAADKQGIDNAQMSFLDVAASALHVASSDTKPTSWCTARGGYVFANFLKFGGPMQVIQLIVSVSVVLLDSKWWIGWVAGSIRSGGDLRRASSAEDSRLDATPPRPSARRRGTFKRFRIISRTIFIQCNIPRPLLTALSGSALALLGGKVQQTPPPRSRFTRASHRSRGRRRVAPHDDDVGQFHHSPPRRPERRLHRRRLRAARASKILSIEDGRTVFRFATHVTLPALLLYVMTRASGGGVASAAASVSAVVPAYSLAVGIGCSLGATRAGKSPRGREDCASGARRG